MGKAVHLPKPTPRTGSQILVPALLVIYLAGRIIEVLPLTEPSTSVVAIEILSALAFALVDGAHRLGLRSTLVFAGVCLTIGGAMETLGVDTRFPFGRYEFLPLMGFQVLHVPVLLGLAYIGMAYASWTVAVTIAGVPNKKLSTAQSLAVPLLASVVMTSWDFAQDPVWSTLLHVWRWNDGGTWFGVPLTNYLGWLLTTSLIYLAFAAYNRRSGESSITRPINSPCAALALYALCAFGNIVQLFKPQASQFVADNTGTYSENIFHSPSLRPGVLLRDGIFRAARLASHASSGNRCLYRLNNSRSRFVCARLTGISVCFLSFIRSW